MADEEIIRFMQQYSFATIVSQHDGRPIATHLPFVVARQGDELLLSSHFARANKQWEALANGEVLVIFSEPHAYISPAHYDKIESVPTWNYLAVHAYGRAVLVHDEAQSLEILEKTIMFYEPAYRDQWAQLSPEFKQKMMKGIVAFEVHITELQGKKKLSQNKTTAERTRIAEALSASPDAAARAIAAYMQAAEKE